MAVSEGGNGRAGAEGAAAARPPSRLKEITSRGLPTSPEEMFNLALAGSVDVVNEAIDRRDVTVMCRGLQTGVSIARNAEPLAGMFNKLESQRKDREEESRLARIRQLQDELARLEDEHTRPLPQKG